MKRYCLKPCSVPGCRGHARNLGLCMRHYTRLAYHKKAFLHLLGYAIIPRNAPIRVMLSALKQGGVFHAPMVPEIEEPLPEISKS